MQEIDNNLIKDSSLGNMEAFEQIYRIISPYVYRVVYQIINNEHDAQDVTQDVFVKIYNKLQSFNFKSSFKTWVYKISVNTAIDAISKRSKEEDKKVDYDVVIQSAPQMEDAVNKNIETEDKKSVLSLFLKRLTPDQRICLHLREIEGLTYKEIAKTLNINVNAVRSRLKRARQSIISLKRHGGSLL